MLDRVSGSAGRHARPAGHADPARSGAPPSLGRIASIVLRSAVAPGTGHLATGHRRSGWLILTAAVLVLAAVVAGISYAVASPADAASLTVRPTWLTAVRWTAIGVAVAWIAVIISAAVLARPGARGIPGRIVASVVTAVLVAAVALPAAVVTRYAQVQSTFVQNVFDDQPATGSGSAQAAPASRLKAGRLNVLLVGSDAGADRTGTRTDTVILASLDTKTGRTVLFSLPRNLERVPFAPGSVMAKQFPNGFNCGDECLLNAIYRYGTDHPTLFPGDPDPGMTALTSGVTATLGVPVDYHALIDLAGFQKLVDALGGVTIRVDRRLPIGGLDAAGNHVKPSGYIQPGLQHMNGETALAYARSRSDGSDYERVLRQRCLLGALQHQADPRNLLTNFQELATSTADALQTDIPRSLLPDLVKLAFQVKSQPITSLPFTPPLVDVGRPDFAGIRAAVQSALLAPAPSSTPSATPPATTSPSAGPSSGTATPSPSATPGTAPVPLSAVCSYQ